MDEKENKQVESLATEMLRELKATSKRWFIAFIATLLLWFATIGGFLWYIGLPVDEISVENQDGNANYIGNDLNGVINNGENITQEESNTEPQT